MAGATPAIDRDYRIEDKYQRAAGRVFLTGIEALVRLPMLQHQLDRAAGLDTAGYISGYRGSPLGGYDAALWKAKDQLSANQIVFEPGLNEELAATAVWGTQQFDMYPGTSRHDGVFGMWYGKAPGVDRAMDALRHGNLAGTARHGGVLVIAGDDHACQSSSIPNSSDLDFHSAAIPILQPAGAQDILDLGIKGFAMSRYAGIWMGMKFVVDTVESGGSVLGDLDRYRTVTPQDFELPPEGMGIRWPDSFPDQEKRLHGIRLDAVRAFARANAINRIVLDSPRARIGIVAAGKSYLDVRQALADLGIGEAEARAAGLRVYKLGMSWPVEPVGLAEFAEGLEEIFVVEEKRGLIEEQIALQLYRAGGPRPRIVGKRDDLGAPLLPDHGEIDSSVVGHALVARFDVLGIETRAYRQRLVTVDTTPSEVVRQAYFCSGCPHNRSTLVPEGSRAMSGIGCHGMVMWMPERRTGPVTQMGGEGMHWVGQAPFSTEKHAFQNLGDGTYSHSGLLAIRAAAAAGVNITYKILYNDAVAMTGGQPVEGQLTVPQITRQVAAEGAKRTVIVTDEPKRHAAATDMAPGVTIRHRDEMDAVQRELRDTPGLTILIYDQTCAAEKRRRRKRGRFPDPPRRLFINQAVCEGCGDCQVASNCIAISPVETDLGLKREIDQSACNKDYSCVAGFCPSFVSVHGGAVRKSVGRGLPAIERELPDPDAVLDRPYSILIAGIGGTGVITIGHIIGMAGHIEGRGVTVLDNTGMAQKNGAVLSHVRLAPTPEDLFGVRVSRGGADLLLGCDLVTSVSPAAMGALAEGRSWAVVNADVAPVAAGLGKPDFDMNTARMRGRIEKAIGAHAAAFVGATDVATRLFGDSIAANLFLLGYAYQLGRLPLSEAAIHRAIELNGVGIDTNIGAFRWGRLAVVDRDAMLRAAGLATEALPEKSLAELVDHRVALLTAYQNAAYARRYADVVARVRAAEEACLPGSDALGRAVARTLSKLMAYKDEYEVGRLYTDPAFRTGLAAQFEGAYKLSFHLAPPILERLRRGRRDPKWAFGAWMMPVFGMLAKLKGLRGTIWDPFGHSAERRRERQDVDDYLRTVDEILGCLSPRNHHRAVAAAELPLGLRGYAHVKDRNRARIAAELVEIIASLDIVDEREAA